MDMQGLEDVTASSEMGSFINVLPIHISKRADERVLVLSTEMIMDEHKSSLYPPRQEYIMQVIQRHARLSFSLL